MPGLIAVACIAFIFGCRYLIDMAAWWSIAIFVVGVILILLEIFVFTGFGIPAILGIICCLVGLVAALLPNGANSPGPIPIPQTSLDWSIFKNGIFALGVGAVAGVIAIFVLASYLPKLPLAGKLVLAPVATAADAALEEDDPLTRIKPGDVGTVEATCRPVGKVRFGDQAPGRRQRGLDHRAAGQGARTQA